MKFWTHHSQLNIDIKKKKTNNPQNHKDHSVLFLSLLKEHLLQEQPFIPSYLGNSVAAMSTNGQETSNPGNFDLMSGNIGHPVRLCNPGFHTRLHDLLGILLPSIMLYLKPIITVPTTKLSRVTCFVKRYEIRDVLGTCTNLNVN